MSRLFTPLKDIIGNLKATKPKEVSGLFNKSVLYYQQKLTDMLCGRFEITNMPEWWSKSFVYTTLLMDGYICITDFTGMGVTPFQCNVSGYNVFSEPNEVMVANVVLGTFTRNIGIDCSVPKVKPNYMGYRPMIDRYAYMLASADAAIDVNLMNSKLAYIFRAQSDKEAKEIKGVYDMVSAGSPAVYTSDKIPIDPYAFPVKANYIADMVQQTKRKIMEEFLTDIGIDNSNTYKKERLITSEAESNLQELHVCSEFALELVNEGLDWANKRYGMNMEFKWKEWNDGGNTGSDITGNDGSVPESV